MRALNCIKPARQSNDINMYENLQHIQLAVDGHQTHHMGQDKQLEATSHYFFVQSLTPLATHAGFKLLKYLLISI